MCLSLGGTKSLGVLSPQGGRNHSACLSIRGLKSLDVFSHVGDRNHSACLSYRRTKWICALSAEGWPAFGPAAAARRDGRPTLNGWGGHTEGRTPRRRGERLAWPALVATGLEGRAVRWAGAGGQALMALTGGWCWAACYRAVVALGNAGKPRVQAGAFAPPRHCR
jgi:hypothetical protein